MRTGHTATVAPGPDAFRTRPRRRCVTDDTANGIDTATMRAMRRIRSRRAVCLLAALAMLWTMLGPLAAQLQQAGSQARLTALVHVLCSASGTRTLSAPADALVAADQSGDDQQASLAHCPLCASSALGAALPPSPVVTPLAVTRDGFPPRFYSAPGPSPIWRAALSRGPPAHA